jgi:hypothetical protein
MKIIIPPIPSVPSRMNKLASDLLGGKKGEALRIGDTTDTTIGNIRLHSNKLEFYNGSAWVNIGSISQWKEPVNTPADLPLTGNTIGDMRLVIDDGDGKAAMYQCKATTGNLAAQWNKISDVDWSTAILDEDFSGDDGVMVKTGAGTYTLIKNKWDGTAAPTVNDDTDGGYSVGSRWLDLTNSEEYVCMDATDGAAVWTETTGAGSVPGDPTVVTSEAELAAAATAGDNNILVDGQITLTGDITFPTDPVTKGCTSLKICGTTPDSKINFGRAYSINIIGTVGEKYQSIEVCNLQVGGFATASSEGAAFEINYIDSNNGLNVYFHDIFGTTESSDSGSALLHLGTNAIGKVKINDVYLAESSTSIMYTADHMDFSVGTKMLIFDNCYTAAISVIKGSSHRSVTGIIVSSCPLFKIDDTTDDVTYKDSIFINTKIAEADFYTGTTGNNFTNCTFLASTIDFTTELNRYANIFNACSVGSSVPYQAYSLNEDLRKYTCTSTEAVGNLVYATSTADTVNQADATTSKIPFGLIAYKPSSTTCWVKHNGIMGGYSGLTAGGKVYSTASGGITQTSNGTAPVGVAISATEVMFNITVSGTDVAYGAMYLDDNSTAQVIETANTPIPIQNFTFQTALYGGLKKQEASTGAITEYSDYSGTMAGTTLVTSTGHGLTTGETIYIRGTTNYNGRHVAYVVSNDTFYIDTAYVADDGASDWDSPDGFIPYAEGVYKVCYELDVLEATPSGGTLTFSLHGTDYYETQSKRVHVMSDAVTAHVTGIAYYNAATIEPFAPLFHITVESDSTNNITCSNGIMTVEKLN